MTDRAEVRAVWEPEIFRKQRQGGISRYFSELHRGLRGTPGVAIDIPLRWTDNAHLVESGGARRRPDWARSRPAGLADRAARRIGLPALTPLASGRRPSPRPDLLHATYYSRPSPARGWGRAAAAPLVTTIHDCIPERLPDVFPAGPHPGKEWHIRNADLLLCVSESTRRDLEDLYGPIRGRIVVTPLGVDPVRFTPDGPRHDGPPRPWILFVGDRQRHKDFATLLAALANGRTGAQHLVVAGTAPVDEEESRRIRRLGLGDRITFLRPSDDQLPALYRGADALVVPSRYEGFGLPILEALACGTPVVAADSSSMPEVGGDLAAYFAPGDAEGLADSLRSLLDDEQRCAATRRSGPTHAARFRWETTADLTATAYRSLVGR